MQKIKLLLVGGGSGGHIYPLLSVSEYLLEHRILSLKDLHFVIAKNNADYKYFENTQYSYSEVSVAKLRRYFSWGNFLDFFIFIKNIFSSFFFLLKNRPEKIFSKGGFVSLPFGISAFFLRIPFYLHETDSAMGLSNKILSTIATKIFTGFPSEKNNCNNIFVGNPVRKEFFIIPEKTNIDDKNKINKKIKNLKILVFGGSQGAQRINEWARNFFPSVKNIKILLVTGKNKKSEIKNKNITEVEFLSDTFIEEIHKADIVITRAGGSVAELAAAKKCVVLIPLPSSANDHQRSNAKYFSEKNAVLWIEESELGTKEKMLDLLDLFSSFVKQQNYAKNLAKLAQPKAIENIVKGLELW